MSLNVKSVTHFIHRFFLPLLLASYILAGYLPELGLYLRKMSFGSLSLPGMGPTNISPSLLMLSFLLFNAGMGIKTKELWSLQQKFPLLAIGFLANIIIPILLIISLRGSMGLWHNPEELQNLLVGLAIIIAMPIAGSSAAWSQNANGNMGLTLGLVLLSTILSPLTTPLVLHFFGFITSGDFAEDLHEIAQQGVNTFLCLTVVIPSLAGIIIHYIIGEKKTILIQPYLKLANFIALLILNYSNASTSLPQVFSLPDWDFLAFILSSTIIICSTAYFAGWIISWLFKTDQADQTALMFSLGMNNNGTGLVLATTALADHPAVILPMIFYTIVQQIIAALIDKKIFRTADEI